MYVARHEHLARLDRVHRALRKVNSNLEQTSALPNLPQDLDHFQVSFGLLTEARQMPELQAAQAALWQDWIAKFTEMVDELKARGPRPPTRIPTRSRCSGARSLPALPATTSPTRRLTSSPRSISACVRVLLPMGDP